MKKMLSFFCVLMLCTALFAGCASSNQDGGSGNISDSGAGTSQAGTVDDVPTADPVNVRVAALKGPTAMGMVQFMDQVDSGVLADNNYTFSIAAAIDEVTPMLAKGELDIAAIPANVSSVLYNNNRAGFQVLAINTLGVLYIVESGNTVQSVEDLRGKTIYASGKGATPEYALNYILSANGIDPTADVTIEWKSEHAECLSALMAQENAIALLPQPFVTTAQTKSDQIRVALDLSQEWDALQEGFCSNRTARYPDSFSFISLPSIKVMLQAGSAFSATSAVTILYWPTSWAAPSVLLLTYSTEVL